ncbi:MAG: hypothetical protein ABIO70_30725 [Pseudomonadota bacterium]
MAQLGNWFSRVFSNDGTRGLSGDASFIAGEHGRGGFYASRLKLHGTEGDLIDDPGLLWDTGQRGKRRGGLLQHLTNDLGDGIAGFTDVLVVINRADWERAFEESGDYWQNEATELLRGELGAWCKQEQFNEVFPDRPFQVSLACDGGPALRNHAIGLEPGQFVTVLLPNRYGEPLPSSAQVLVVHLNIPGAWEGYRKVGKVYSDQLCFTLGNHWLDNFSHEALGVPALYQLQQYPDGSLVHVINPEYQNRYEVGSVQSAEGPSVLAVTERGGAPVAFLVLGVVDTFMQEQGSSQAPVEISRDWAPEPAPEAPAPASTPAPAGPPTLPEEPAKAAVQLAGESLSPLQPDTGGVKLRNSGAPWHHTIVPDAVEERIFTLKERGALLQRVHFSAFMQGYDVYVSRTGQLGTAIQEPEAVFQVRDDKVFFVARDERILLAGRPAPKDRPLRLRGDLEIRVGNQVLEYRDLTATAAEGWPYLGELRRTAGSTYLVFGSVFRIGRDRRCKVRLPDEPHNDNIVWRVDMGDGEFIRSRNGDIPKSRFYNDSIMVASLHAEIDLEGEPMLRNLARHCFSFVRRGQDIFSLFPARDEKGLRHVDLLPGDEIMVGNNLFEVSYPPPRTPELEKLTAEALARAAESLPDDSFADEPDDPAPNLAAPTAALAVTAEPPVAAPPPAPPPTRSRAVPVALASGSVPVPPGEAKEQGSLSPDPATPDEASPRRPVEVLANPPVLGASVPPEPDLAVEDAPVAAGLGESGPPPRGLAFSDHGFDSLLGLDPPLPRHLEELPTRPKPAASLRAAPIEPPAPAPKRGKKPASTPAPVPEPAPAPVPAPPSAPPAGPPPSAARIAGAPRAEDVMAVDESGWQLSLSRPARLQLIGWMVSGKVGLGNHAGAEVVVPENRTHPQQTFVPQDYARLNLRGRRARIERVAGADARLLVDEQPVEATDEAFAAALELPRRDELGEEDFVVRLVLSTEPWLPDPRAALLGVELEERMVAAMFTRGLPLRAPTPIRLGPVDCIAQFDGQRLRISDYLDSYAFGDGRYQPFFWRRGPGRFLTVPEDGAPIDLENGDMLIAGRAVYRFGQG